MASCWRTIRLTMFFVTITAALAQFNIHTVLAQSSDCNTNDPGAPCFANNPDILGGQQQHNLLRTDDLMFLKYAVQSGGYPNYLDEWQLNTTNSLLSSPAFVVPDEVGSLSSSPHVAIGRMYNVGKDTVVTLLEPNILQYIAGRPLNSSPYIVTGLGYPVNSITMADFTGDGYAEVVVNAGTNTMAIATANDVNTPFALKWGPVALLEPLSQMVVGDFNGDGQLEIAGLSPCSPPSSATLCTLNIYTVDPMTLTITRAASTPAIVTAPVNWLAAGRFGAPNYDQLVTATLGNPGVSSSPYYVQSWDFTNGSLQPIPKATAEMSFSNTYPSAATGFFSGRFIPGAYDQVIAVTAPKKQSKVAIGLVTFSHDSNLTPSFVGNNVSLPGLTVSCPFDVTVGNFARTQNNQYDPHLNVAVAGTDCGSNAVVQVFTVDPNDSGTSVTYTSPQTQKFSALQATGTFFRVAAGDIQGRSIPVGQPEKATVTQHIQPDTIIGAPPMHVDWITPAGESAPTILNVSVFPQTFNTGYDFADTTGSQTSRKTTTSYTSAFKETSTQKVSYGVPKISQISTTFKEAATQTHQNTIDKTYNTNQGQSFKLTARTGFDDLVAATASQMNIYSYPVLGQCVDAPGTQPLDGCPADTAPVYVQFSGPDNVYYLDLVEGRALEWYQPVHEPGNIFSYPGSLTQLQTDQPQQPTAAGGTTSSLQLLSPGNIIWDSQSTQQVAISWTQGAGSDVSSGSVNTHSFDRSVTVSGKVKIEGTTISGSASLDYNTSDSVSTLNQSSNTYSESAGVLLNRGIGGGPSSSGSYLYQGQAFIFGQQSPLGTIQTDIPQNTDVKAQGFLAVGYASNPLSTGAIQSGNFWKQAYTVAPDVALNHPQRWLQQNGTNGQQVQFNCPIGFTSSFDQPACAPISQSPTPLNVADALFYQIKGLFVTPGATTDGPPTTLVTQGDTVTLQARVYNYSLANMTDDTQVRVQFYAQPWDATAGQFLSQPGNPNAFAPAVFIGEDDLAPIPAFCGGSQGNLDPCMDDSAPRNWTFAQTTWDTSAVNANTDWIFWVVVWMERNGQKVAEIQDHGLTAIPGSPLNSLADIPIETYSNNLGFYNQVFHVGSITTAIQSTGPKQFLSSNWVNLPTGAFLPPHQLMTVRVRHRAFGASLDNVMALFYDGDPALGGKLFDMELIPHIKANASFVTRVPFASGVCGTHQLFVHVIPTDGAAAPATDVRTVTVECPPPNLSVTEFQGKAHNVDSRTNNANLQLSGKVLGVGALDLSAATLQLIDLLRESNGAGELVRDSLSSLLPLRLTARRGSRATAAIFESSPMAAPKTRIEIKQRDPHNRELEFSIKVERAVIKAAQLCKNVPDKSTRLQTHFMLTDGVHESVEMRTEQLWQCKGGQLRTP